MSENQSASSSSATSPNEEQLLPPTNLYDYLNKLAINQGFQQNEYIINKTQGSNVGDGFMAEMIGIQIVGDRYCSKTNQTIANDQLNVVCKLLPENVAFQELFQSRVIFERECYFYNEIVPILNNFQKLNPANGFYAYPKCYFAIAERSTNQYLIIMNDLRSDGYGMWNKFMPIGRDQVHLVMIELARLHAVSMSLHHIKPEIFQQLATALDHDGLLNVWKTKELQTIFNQSYDRAIDVLHKSKDKKQITIYRETWLNKIETLLDKKSKEIQPFLVINHGDCWNNNLMFSSIDNNQRICLVDWQACRLGSPALDISYYLMSSTDQQLRSHFPQLIETYHEYFVQTMDSMFIGVQNRKFQFTLNDLYDQLKRHGEFGLIMAPMLITAMVMNFNELGDLNEMSESTVGKPDLPVETTTDEDKDDKKPVANTDMVQFSEKSKNEYRKRLSDAIDDARQFKFI